MRARTCVCACVVHVRARTCVCACVVHACVISHTRCVISHMCYIPTVGCSPGGVCLSAEQQDILILQMSQSVISSLLPAFLPGAVCLFAQQRDDFSAGVLYPCCFLHVQQEPCAYLPNSETIYLQMCYILAVSCMFSRNRVTICPTARYINFTDVLYPRCCPRVQQEPVSCANLSNSEILYLQMCYILAVSCMFTRSRGPICPTAR